MKTSLVCTQYSSDDRVLRTVEPFLRVLSHPSLLDSISVDSFLGVIYRSFGGTNGDRAFDLFRKLCHRLKALVAYSPTSDVVANTTKLMLKVLHELLIREHKSRFNDELPPLFEGIDDLLNTISEFNPDLNLCDWKEQLNTTKRIVDIATGRLVRDISQDNLVSTTNRPTNSFPLTIEGPGGRHSNDHPDIASIQILPTLGEISCGQAEYMPSTNLLQTHHLRDPVHRHIDSLFRLMRQDIFGSVKDVLGDLLAQEGQPFPTLAKNDARAHTYTDSAVQHVFMHERQGLQAVVSFRAPAQLRNKNKSERRRWWQETSRLEEGSLVCLLTSNERQKSLLFLEVVAKAVDEAREEGAPQKREKSCLVPDTGDSSITVKLASMLQGELRLLVQIYQQRRQIRSTLVEFHNLLPATFTPVLKNLQLMIGEGHVALQQWMVPGESGTGSGVVPPPSYALKPGFTFHMKSIIQEDSAQGRDFRFSASTLHEGDWKTEIETLRNHTSLDRGQCVGLLAALGREFSLIQGPPGTGKSYVGVQIVRILLENKKAAALGPILIICYTNHALDQFLKHLLDVGINKIIRIGGRSTEPELEGKNLRVVSKELPKTRVESQILGKAYSEMQMYMETADANIRPLQHVQNGASWANVRHYLRNRNPSVYRQLDPDHKGPEEFKFVGRDPLSFWLGRRPHVSGNDAGAVGIHWGGDNLATVLQRAEQNIEALTSAERWSLADYWLQDMREEQTDRLFERINAAERNQADITAVHSEVDRRALAQAHVIGLTTTALAKNITLLRRIRPKVVICEEAGEVMEPHVLSAMMPGVEHLIQIGDHRQLRPQINDFSLSSESSSGMTYQLDRSQFERRAMGEPGLAAIPIAQLNVQRRMRPEISNLIRHVYPNLEDHESVQGMPDVVGIRKNLFWLDHDHHEDSTNDGVRVRSHSNQWEVDMASGLVRHLVRQGRYNSTDIALLTPYTGQLRKLRHALSKDFEIFLSDRDQDTLAAEGVLDDMAEEKDVVMDQESAGADRKMKNRGTRSLVKKALAQTLRLATVDNFQGEEAKVIIVSLVRSNAAHKVGFLRTENRINVLLSRAQHGMYLIGSSETYLHVPMWSKCPSYCGEECPEGFCQECGHKSDQRVDMLEFKEYSEIDVNETPIVVLGCGHFFTGETLDGLVDLSEVYSMSNTGEVIALRDLSKLTSSSSVPCCPDCKRPIRQFATRRYNRVINRAVMDETSKRFITRGREDLEKLERRLVGIEEDIETTQANTQNGRLQADDDWNNLRRKSQAGSFDGPLMKLASHASKLRRDMDIRHQPSRKLFEAIVARRQRSLSADVSGSDSLDQRMNNLSLDAETAVPDFDRRVTLGASLIWLKAREVALQQRISMEKKAGLVTTDAQKTVQMRATRFMKDCAELIADARKAFLIRIEVGAILALAKTSMLVAGYTRGQAALTPTTEKEKESFEKDKIKELLDSAADACEKLQDAHGRQLQDAVQAMLRLYEGPRYEAVTSQELAAIKSAMVSGAGGLSTHSGHWYNCENGHPFAIGECGMPMEQARCPECGAPIGGQSHQLIAGVTRASEME
ncbi:hypothetical protein LQW54_002378 [Pestalotiopsis sp. IQ-011]